MEAVKDYRLRRWALLLILILGAGGTLAQAASTTDPVLAHGAADGSAPAWAVAVDTPAGWTRDCCTYARAIGVAAVLYQGEWTGKPQRVMVLNVWPRKLPTLAAEVQADRQRYRQRDPAGKAGSFPLRNPHMPCVATLYQGSDRVDDVVVFCEPDAASGVRLSWSMAMDADDTTRRALLDHFMQVAVNSRYLRYLSAPAHGA